MSAPLVSIVCLCYNHAPFVKEALQSVFNQSYTNWELIVVDDCSTDGSPELIEDILRIYPQVVFIRNNQNLGNCKSFNAVLPLTQGKYLIDLAADDVLLPERLQNQVSFFESSNYGFIYSNAKYIDVHGNFLRYHVDKKNKLDLTAEGDIFKRLFEGHFICSPTVMFRNEVLKQLGGYDENLSYEDFDIWMRIARNYKVGFQDIITTSKRVVPGSLSSQFYIIGKNKLLESTFLICNKALNLCANDEEFSALSTFVKYHLRQSFLTANFKLTQEYYQLLKSINRASFFYELIVLCSKMKLNLSLPYRVFLLLRLKNIKI